MSPSWIWSDKITNERVARVAYNHFISNKGEWNNCFSKFSNRVLPPIFISTILQSGKFLNFAHYFPYDVKLRLLAHSRRFLANQKAWNAIVGAENLLIGNNRILVIRFTAQSQTTSMACYGACLKWLLLELSFSDRWSRRTKLWERDCKRSRDDDVILLRGLSSNANPIWLVIVEFSHSPGVACLVWMENTSCVLKMKTPLQNFSGLLQTEPNTGPLAGNGMRLLLKG